MLHFYYFISRKSSLSKVAFHNYWKDTHGPIAKEIPQLQRYIQSHQIPDVGFECGFDGVAEGWVENFSSLEELRSSKAYLNDALTDERNFIDRRRTDWLVTRDRVILDGPKFQGQVKNITLLRRKDGMSVKEFRDYWSEVHGPLACELPGIQRYVQSPTVDEAYTLGEPRWDGVAQWWTNDLQSLKSLRASKEFSVGAREDAEKFLETSMLLGFVANEIPILE